MSRIRSEAARLRCATGWMESKVGKEMVGEGEDAGMLVAMAVGNKVDVAVAALVGVIATMGVEGV